MKDEYTELTYVQKEYKLTKKQAEEAEKVRKEMADYLQNKFEQMTISAMMGCIHGEYTVIKDKQLP